MAFKKGQSGNPKGRKKGIPNKRTELLSAIKYVQGTKNPETGKKRKKLLVHAVEQAYGDKTVLIALLKKLIPDMRELDVEVSGVIGLRQLLDNIDGKSLGPTGVEKKEYMES